VTRPLPHVGCARNALLRPVGHPTYTIQRHLHSTPAGEFTTFTPEESAVLQKEYQLALDNRLYGARAIRKAADETNAWRRSVKGWHMRPRKAMAARRESGRVVANAAPATAVANAAPATATDAGVACAVGMLEGIGSHCSSKV
jgi:hypothetical protein